MERKNRAIKDATVKRFHYDHHGLLKTQLVDFMPTYNFECRHNTLSGLKHYEYICQIWTSDPDRFTLNPIHQMLGLNTWPSGHNYRKMPLNEFFASDYCLIFSLVLNITMRPVLHTKEQSNL